MFYLNPQVLVIFPWRKGQLVQIVSLNSLDSFYVTDSPLSVTNIAEMALFYLNWPVLMILPLEEGPVSQICDFNKFVTVSMIQIVL